jgi:hypothetical protein
MRTKYDWQAALRYYASGHTVRECCEKFGFTVAAWYKALERGAIPRPPRQNAGGSSRYDWAMIQRYYDQGHSYRECRLHFGFAAESWRLAAARGKISARAQLLPLEKLLSEGRCTTNIKARLIAAGLLQDRCSECGLIEWRGRKLSIQIDHVNGIHNDNRLENLRMLCPNCHSQTDTFGARNIARRNRNPTSDPPIARER